MTTIVCDLEHDDAGPTLADALATQGYAALVGHGVADDVVAAMRSTSLKFFDLVWVMTGGGPNRSTDLMATYMYQQAFSSFRMGYGSAIATLLRGVSSGATIRPTAVRLVSDAPV